MAALNRDARVCNGRFSCVGFRDAQSVATPSFTDAQPGIDRFMPRRAPSAILIGNGVATFVVAKWEAVLDTAVSVTTWWAS
jgi:hypothetical protein